MYLQITNKCNMRCAHCCYSCNSHGKHMDFQTALHAIGFATDYGTDTISIGGGEPTLHPRFFDILKECLREFDYVWMATNGSKTKIMYRLASIIENRDYENFEYGIFQEDKLSVALSQDCFHDPIDERIVSLWEKRSQSRNGHYEIRNVTHSMSGVAAQGRAKRTGSGWGEHCVCTDHVIRPDGSVKMCGCTGAPIIGDIWNGIDDKWDPVLQSEKYLNSNCYRDVASLIRCVKKAA